ncbi:MAG: hypothetical protein GKR88_07395 [Flavobacteriaceae bacterium]|nr:MAG: hypothetical protein GKR88_07395 [Flavobacteriaceae bacterium]
MFSKNLDGIQAANFSFLGIPFFKIIKNANSTKLHTQNSNQMYSLVRILMQVNTSFGIMV